MLIQQQVAFNGMDQDLDEAKFQGMKAIENYNVRFITNNDNTLTSLTNERNLGDEKLLNLLNSYIYPNGEKENYSYIHIVGFQRITNNDVVVFFYSKEGTIKVCRVMDNEDNELSLKPLSNNPKDEPESVQGYDDTIMDTEVIACPKEIIQTTFGEDVFGKYVFWTSKYSNGLQKLILDYKTNEERNQMFELPFCSLDVKVLNNGGIRQGYIKYALSVVNNLGIESRKVYSDWYYIIDNDNIENTKSCQINITPDNFYEQGFNIPSISRILIYAIHSSSYGIEARYVGDFDKTTTVVIDNGLGQPIDKSLLMNDVEITPYANCLEVHQDRLFISTKQKEYDKDWIESDDNSKYTNIEFSDTNLYSKENDKLSDTSRFYGNNYYQLAIQELDKFGKVIRTTFKKAPNAGDKFYNEILVDYKTDDNDVMFLRPLLGIYPVSKFVSNAILNPTLEYFKDYTNTEKTKHLKSSNSIYMSSIFRPNVKNIFEAFKHEEYIFGNNYKEVVYDTINSDGLLNSDKNRLKLNNLDKSFLYGDIDKYKLLMSFAEFRHLKPLIATGGRGCEFCFDNIVNGNYSKRIMPLVALTNEEALNNNTSSLNPTRINPVYSYQEEGDIMEILEKFPDLIITKLPDDNYDNENNGYYIQGRLKGLVINPIKILENEIKDNEYSVKKELRGVSYRGVIGEVELNKITEEDTENGIKVEKLIGYTLSVKEVEISSSLSNIFNKMNKRYFSSFDISLENITSHCFRPNRKIVQAVLPFKNELFIQEKDLLISINPNYYTFTKSKAYCFCDLDLSKGFTNGEVIANPLTQSTWNGLVFETEDKDYAYKELLCAPRIIGNPDWVGLGVGKDYEYRTKPMYPKMNYEYNVAFTPLYSPRKVMGDIEVNQKTINIREIEESNKLHNFNPSSIKVLKYMTNIRNTYIAYNIKQEELYRVYNNIKQSIIGVLNRTNEDIPYGNSINYLKHSAENYNRQTQFLNYVPEDIYLRKGIIKNRICCGYAPINYVENLSYLDYDHDKVPAFNSPIALTLDLCETSLIGYPYPIVRGDWKGEKIIVENWWKTFVGSVPDIYKSGNVYLVSTGQGGNLLSVNGEDAFQDGIKNKEHATGVNLTSYYNQSDTLIEYNGCPSILLELSDKLPDDENSFNNIDSDAFIYLANIYNNIETQTNYSPNKFFVSGDVVRVVNKKAKVKYSIGDLFYGKLRYIPTLPSATANNKVLDVIDRYGFSQDDSTIMYSIDETLLLYTDDYNQIWKKNVNFDSVETKNIFSYSKPIYQNKTEANIGYRLYWSLPFNNPLINVVSAYSKIYENNYLDLDMTAGDITKILSYKDKLYVFQQKKVSIISYNDRQLLGQEGDIPVIVRNSALVQGFTPITDHWGLQRHYSCAIGETGIYFLDQENKEMFMIGGEQGTQVIPMSANINMFTFFRNDIINDKEYVLFNHHRYKEIYLSNWFFNIGNKNYEEFSSFIMDNYKYIKINDNRYKKYYEAGSVVYSELLSSMTSFYSIYDRSLGSILLNNNEYLISENGIRKWYDGKYDLDFYSTMLSNPNGSTDNVYTNIEYRSNSWNPCIEEHNNKKNYHEDYYENPIREGHYNDYTVQHEEELHPSFTHVRAFNHYQDTDQRFLEFKKHNPSLLKRFNRTWRIQIPFDNRRRFENENRLIRDVRRDRIRSSWTKFTLTKVWDESLVKNLRFNLHNIFITFDMKN